MAKDTKIQWATHTFNPWRGCQKVAPGCANCYADAQSKRNPGTLGVWGPNGTRVVASEAMWREPMKWQRAERERRECCLECEDITPRCEQCGPRPRVFCASLADVFEDWGGQVSHHAGVPMWRMHERNGHAWNWGAGHVLDDPAAGSPLTLDDVRSRLFRLWRSTLNLDYLALTKRPENARRMLDGRHENLWLGASIACQGDADRNVPELLKCRDLCAKAFLSIEPLIGPVSLTRWFGPQSEGQWLNTVECGHSPNRYGVNWVIVGGESGPNARPCNVEWIRSIVRQCQAAGVPCFVKQTGAVVLDGNPGSPCSWPGLTEFRQANEWCRVLIRDPKGGDMAEWPEDIRVREVPQ